MLESFKWVLLALAVSGGALPLAARAQSFEIGPGISGSWYDDEKVGQGYTIQYVSADVVLLTWFTFDTQGKQAWMQGIGEVQGSSIVFEQLLRPMGGSFGPGFDPDDVVQPPAGSLTLTFESCDAGIAEYSGSGSFPADTLNLSRLTYLGGVACAGNVRANLSGTLRAGTSGAWFDPSHTGEGWIVELVNDELAVIYWFSYDTDGNQSWFLSVAEINGNSLIALESFRPTGARFGAAFDSADVVNNPWAPFALTYHGCGQAVAASVAVEDYPEVSFSNVQQLVFVEGTQPCNFGAELRDITGTLQGAPDAYVDGDTNDLNQGNVDNDNPAQPQETGNPALISGYATAQATGEGDTRFENSADIFDGYRMALTAGQSLQLVLADWDENNPARNDLDLLLFDADDASMPIATSESIQRNEFIAVEDSGIYDVVVLAFKGSSTYTLAASSAPIPTNAIMLSSLGDFVPGQMIVGLEQPVTGAPRKRVQNKIAQRYDLRILQAAVGPAPALYKLNEGKIKRNTAFDKLAALGWGSKGVNPGKAAVVAAIKALGADEAVRYAEPNGMAYAQATFNDPLLASQQWHYGMINLPQAWEVSTGRPQTRVAVLDTGVAEHPDLAGNVRYDLGLDAVYLPLNTGDGTGADTNARDPGSFGSHFHGTHVSGTIGAVAGNNRYGTGVAPDVTIEPVRVLGIKGGTVKAITNGIYWAAGDSVYPNLQAPPPVDVINMSLGGPGGCSQAYRDAINFARSQGVIVVAAAGNDNSTRLFNPTACGGVVSVAAVDRDYNPAFYSNCHSTVDVAAPGGEIFSENPLSPKFPPANGSACRSFSGGFANRNDGVFSTVASFPTLGAGFSPLQGTSMAAPHVAGVAALMKSIHPPLTPARFDNLLMSGSLTDDLLQPGKDRATGYGLINALKAVSMARELAGGGSLAPMAVAVPSSLTFAEITTGIDLRLDASGDGPIAVDSVAATAPWLSVDPREVNGQGFGNYRISVDRTGLVDGNHVAEVVFATTTAGEVRVPASLRVGPQLLNGDAGFVYALLIDPVTFVVVRSLAGRVSGPGVVFKFEDVLPGDYVLFAGTDIDADFFICDLGEVCGFYPDSTELQTIEVRQGNLALGPFTVFPDTSGVGSASGSMISTFSSSLETFDTALEVWRREGISIRH